MNPKDRHPLGKTGLSVSRFGLGGAPLGNLYSPLPEQQAQDTIQRAYDQGVLLFDTAPLYGYGLSEHRMGHTLRTKERKDYVLCTKVGRYLLPQTAGEVQHNIFKINPSFKTFTDYSYEGTMRAVEQSYQRLGIYPVDILLIHDLEPEHYSDLGEYNRQFEIAMKGAYHALNELKRSGDIKAIGVGLNSVQGCLNFSREGDFDCFMLAGRYTLLEQESLEELLPICLQKNISILIAGSYNSGILATGAVPGAKYDYQPAPAEIMEKVSRIEAVCQRYNTPLAAAAIQFPLAHPAIAAVVSGAAKPEEVDQNMQLMSRPIPHDLWQELKHEGLLREDAPVASDEDIDYFKKKIV